MTNLDNEIQPTTNYALALVGALVGAIGGAFTWWLIAMVFKLEIYILSVAIGIIVGDLTRRLAKVPNFITGLISAVFSFLSIVVAMYFVMAYFNNRVTGYSLGTCWKDFCSQDPKDFTLTLLFIAGAVGSGFYIASGKFEMKMNENDEDDFYGEEFEDKEFEDEADSENYASNSKGFAEK